MEHDDRLLRDLYAFFGEHRRCGELDGGVEGDRVWMTCTCGASIVRLVPLAPATGDPAGR